MRKHAGLLVKAGVIERVEVGNHLHIEQLVGDHFSSCFSVPGSSPTRKIYSFCDDMGLHKPDLPWNVILHPSLYDGAWPIRGPIVITSCNREGETISMTELEMSAIRIAGSMKVVFDDEVLPRLPLLSFLPGYDVRYN